MKKHPKTIWVTRRQLDDGYDEWWAVDTDQKAAIEEVGQPTVVGEYKLVRVMRLIKRELVTKA